MNSKVSTVFQPSKSPIVSFRIQFLTGSVDDPKGKEGLASLTAAILAQGGSKKLSYDEIVEQFYPMATSFGWQVDKEMTTFVGSTHADNLDKYYGLISQMLLEPGFREDDFRRLKQDAINFLKTSLREGNDEELGKERLYNIIYAAHPYEHHSMGTINSLERLTLNDVRDFYAKNYTRANLVLGMSGGFNTKFSNQFVSDFQKLPQGKKMTRRFPAPRLENGMKIDIVQRETRATAISLGFPISVNRAHKDFAALALVNSYFGQHRSSNSYLYGRLRELRGLNYGDYAYMEYFPRGMFQFEPDPNLARQQQIFQIWIRPVEPQNANFTLRAALYEYDKLVKNGLDQKTFEETRDFLIKYVNILTQTKDAELGHALDSRYYGIPNFNQYMKTALSKLTLEDVNRAIKTHLASNNMRVVIITKDAEGLRNAIVNNKPAAITYASQKPQEILDEDRVISTYPIRVTAQSVSITPVARVFE
ncbi:MAG: insulinase family protein [Acidobacteria bacterium]|nr:insulinase family protein [Acidobacteriota bacterium]MCA1637912.1 insulinase family protein [Acidobacteriota bacterium]